MVTPSIRTRSKSRRLWIIVSLLIWIEIVVLIQIWLNRSNNHASDEAKTTMPPSPTKFAQLSSASQNKKNDDKVTSTSPSNNNNDNDVNTCAVYMAPSSVHGISSMGIYTTKDLSRGQVIVQASDGLSIAVVDFTTPAIGEGQETQRARREWFNLFGEYWWGRGVQDQLMLEGKTVVDFRITFSELPNHHCMLDSLSPKNPPHYGYNDVLLLQNRTSKNNPGIGAFSYHMGRQVAVRRNVKAGEELFLNYGHCNGRNYNTPDWAFGTLQNKDFEAAARVAARTWNELSEYEPLENMTGKEKEKQLAFFDGIVSEVYEEVSGFNELAASLLPKTYAELKHVMTTIDNDIKDKGRGIAMNLAREFGTTPRTVDWIVENGICVDTIEPKPSHLLPQAGQGAMAKRLINKGQVIAPAPMLHIVDRDVMRLNGSGNSNKTANQLLLNYCFGHHQSTLLLCPITNAMILNHCSTRRKQDCGGQGPNAEYRWATTWDEGKTKEFLNMSMSELARQRTRGLSIEVVATRDIQEGEEVFMDYGKEWEDAWDKHVKDWTPDIPDFVFQSYESPTVLNEKNEPLEMLVTGDLRKVGEHPNLFTGCIFTYSQFDMEDGIWEEELDESSEEDVPAWTKLSDEKLLKRYSTKYGGSPRGDDYADQTDGAYWPCVIIRRDDNGQENNKDTYTVRILQSTLRSETYWYEQDLPRFVTKVPRKAIRYFNQPYSSDQHLLRAFRHHIEFRDDLFPEQWKNLK